MYTHFKRLTTSVYSLQTPYYMWVLITNALIHVGTHYKYLNTCRGYSLQTPYYMLWVLITKALTLVLWGPITNALPLQTPYHVGTNA